MEKHKEKAAPCRSREPRAETARWEALTATVRRELNGCVLTAKDGTALYTPDGEGHYAALWTRDFAYMVMNAGEWFTPQQIRDGLVYILSRPAEDGWIPDKVDVDGVATYTAGGGTLGRPNLDNAAFAVLAAEAYRQRVPAEGTAFWTRWEPVLRRGLAVLPREEHGLIYNDPADPHSPYGFTDCVGKTGALFFESILLWQALTVMRQNTADPVYAKALETEIRLIETHAEPMFVRDDGVFLAATEDCRQADVWGTCYAVASGFPLSEEGRERAVLWLIQQQEGVVYRGQIRHNEPGVYWDRLLCEVPRDTYQNGAYWATATGWYAQAVYRQEPALAARVLADAMDDFETRGVFECVGPGYEKLPHYVVSAANVYGAAGRLRQAGKMCG